MKTKLLILTLCAMALAACNEPGNPVDKNELIKDAIAINQKHDSEAHDYLLSKAIQLATMRSRKKENGAGRAFVNLKSMQSCWQMVLGRRLIFHTKPLIISMVQLDM